MNAVEEDDLFMKPESDPAAAFTVTTNHSTSITGQIGATASQTPSASVQLDLARSSSLTVQYALNTWTLSANKVVNGESRGAVVISPETWLSHCFEVRELTLVPSFLQCRGS
jgi:hypothetical protein